MSDPDTILVLTGIGIPPYSARGLTQTITPIHQVGGGSGTNNPLIRRTINGALVDLTYSQFQKYASEIICKDQQAPAFDGIWPGKQVVVSCVARLTYPSSGAAQRPVVSGSQLTVGGFISYLPILEMRVTDFHWGIDEWGADYEWKLSLVEQ